MPLMRDLFRGAAAGAVSTVPMSAVMLVAQKAGALPKHPPEELTDSVLAAAGVDVDEGTSNLLSTLNHFAFGAAAGAGYAALARLTRGRVRGPLSGIVYGLAVWFASYQGWMPQVTPLPPATDDREDRQAMLAGAHVVYGATLAALASPTR